MKCPKCGSRDIDFQESGGQSICVSCGTVLEENTIVSSIEFQESGDRSHVVGQFVSASCSKPYISGGRGMSRHGDSRDSRDATLVNARRAISQVAAGLRLPSLYIDRAYRLYQLALQRNFIFGRRQTHVVATCLYIICRQEKSPHLLIDFSDSLQVNVYVLGKSFLQFSKILNLNLPVVDPALYIHRYATRLDLGDKINTVITTALRIVSRLKKDWIATGRRPDGICAAAMLIGCRAHGFSIGQGVVSKIFRISSETLKRRLDDFKATPSAQLTIAQFNVNDLDVEFDPPSYIRGMEAADLKENDGNSVYDSDSDLENDDVYAFINSKGLEGALDGTGAKEEGGSKALKTRLEARQTLYGQMYSSALSNKVANVNELLIESKSAEKPVYEEDKQPVKKPRMQNKYVLLVDPTLKINSKGSLIAPEVVVDENEENPLSDGDMEKYFFNEEEQLKRTAIWEKNFRPFMEERQRRSQLKASETTEISEKYTLNGKLRKKYSKRNPVDENTTTSQAVLASTRPATRGNSKKINYDALKGVFAGDGSFAVPDSIGANSSARSLIKNPASSSSSRPSGTAAVKIVAGGAQSTRNVSTLKPDSDVVKSAISEKVAAATNAATEDYDEDEEMLMYDDVNDGDNEYGYDDDEYY